MLESYNALTSDSDSIDRHQHLKAFGYICMGSNSVNNVVLPLLSIGITLFAPEGQMFPS